jgi:hypothetical protein
MNIEVDWYSDNIVLAEFKTPWAWDDFYKAVREMHRLIAQKPHTVHIVIRHHVDFPSGNMLQNFQNAMNQQPKNTGQVFVIPKKSTTTFQSFLQALMQIIGRVNPKKSPIRMVSSLEEAQQIIAHEKTP